MGHKFAELAFTPKVREIQEEMGSRRAYARQDEGPDHHDLLGHDEAAFIASRDSFYMATVSETGWPYIQHRGGTAGFVKILDEKTIGFADFRGNRQYVSIGNLETDNRVSLFFMDYPRQARLKLLGRARLIDLDKEPETIAKLVLPDYTAKVERGFLIDVKAFDWNCPQHITPRFTQSELQDALQPFAAKLETLQAENAELRTRLAALDATSL